jgi:hypothetical protein
MSEAPIPQESSEVPTGHPTPEEIRQALALVLESHEFRASRRCQEFLRFVVETTLSGNSQTLKERTIGVEVFGRAASYDPGNDSTVRVKAGEVRKRLQTFYAGSGAASPIRIHLPAGGYLPEFHRAPLAATSTSLPIPIPEPGRRRWPWIVLAACALSGLSVGAYMLTIKAAPLPDPILRQFWGPALNSSNPVLLCVSYTPVYGLNPALETANAPQPHRVQDFDLLAENFVGGGDMLATVTLSRLITGMGKDYRIKIGRDLSFHDLRTSPSVLIGYSWTRWSSLTNTFRFGFDLNPRAPQITDYGKPTKWALQPRSADRHTDEDFALVCRIFHPDTGTPLILLAGITQYGTEAAADLVSTPTRLQEAVRGLPADWPKKNVQLVLHTRVISGETAAPQVVASHVW